LYGEEAESEVRATLDRQTRARQTDRIIELLSRYALFLALVVLLVVFSIVLSSFATTGNLRNILNNQVTIVILAIGVVFPLAVGEFDLSIGMVVGLGQALVIGLVGLHHVNTVIAIIATLAAGALVGTVNGVLIVKFQVSSMIATLATGSVVTGIVYWYTGGQVIFQNIPPGLVALGRNSVIGIPLPIIYALVTAVVAMIFLSRIPMGRRMYAIGGNRRAAQLIGIRVNGLILTAFIVSALAACLGGIITGAELASASPDIGPELLLPAYAAAFLGATAFRPGQFNVLGSIVGAYFLATASAGLQELGVPSWSAYVFNGIALALAVSLSTQVTRVRTALARRERLLSIRAIPLPEHGEASVAENTPEPNRRSSSWKHHS
jgi:ribose transport system permease protein